MRAPLAIRCAPLAAAMASAVELAPRRRIVIGVDERTVEIYAPYGDYEHPALIAALKGHDPGFVFVKAMSSAGQRRAADGWEFCRITYMRRD